VRRPALIGALFLLAAVRTPGEGAFTSLKRVTIGAVAVTSGTVVLNITADPLPGEAFFGKHVVIPVTVASDPLPIDAQNLKVEMVFQTVSADGKALTPLTSVPISFAADPDSPSRLRGTALVQRDELSGIRRGGKLRYFFRATQLGTETLLSRAGVKQLAGSSGAPAEASDPFEVEIVDTLRSDVSPAGSRVNVADTFPADGETAVILDPGSISGPGVLVIKREDPEGFPAGPRGLKPVLIYSFTLEGTSLLKTAQVVLSYPADVDGKVTDSREEAGDLAPYWLDRNVWRLLSRPRTDTTLHTVMATTPHFSTFALFASGPVSAASLRPTERIITPNGDGVNDTVTFSGLAANEEVKIFDLRGRRVRSIPGPSAVWDGKEDDGRTAESGVYLYQYTLGGERVSGVIAVAK
jgi:gliding motility-associated-like protein